ncbi:ribosomal protein S18-alanine N-acetyltransferase [Marinomonas sp. 2405UD68-3]|uniref:ribosomal protein S18-alanine N-acetyltransferase n=1 Tax=Marinomonas sp. 2405UD68-3 TaxID=3391835 RepID=UPI0039C966C6
MSDLNSIVELDLVSHSYSWGEKLITDALSTRSNWVVEDDLEGKIIGWLTASSLLNESELELILIHPDYRQQGFAKQLMLTWMLTMEGKQVDHFLLEVRASNKLAVFLYLSMGFLQVGLRKNYYSTEIGMEPALLMSRQLECN